MKQKPKEMTTEQLQEALAQSVSLTTSMFSSQCLLLHNAFGFSGFMQVMEANIIEACKQPPLPGETEDETLARKAVLAMMKSLGKA